MFKNYLKISWRNLMKNKTFSIVNITGLAIGLACFLLIALYVTDELSFDKYNVKADRIFRINSDLLFNGTEAHMPVSSDMMGAALKKDYPQVEDFARIYASSGNRFIKKGNDYINEERIAFADSTLFNVFTLPALKGDTKIALNEPNAVVITASTAKKYFGTTDVIGKTVEVKNDNPTLTPFKITAVIKDIPANSHFNFDFLFSMKNAPYPQWGDYLSHNFHTYLLLKPGVDYKAFEKLFLRQYLNKYVLPQAKQYMQINSIEEFEHTGNRINYSLMPLTKIHLYSDRMFELSPSGNVQYVYIFSAVALFILLIACVNFMNLTTARSAGRAKEVGVRKVLGSKRKELIAQFLTESVMMTLFSLMLAILLVYSVLHAFNEIAGKDISFINIFSPVIFPLLFALPIIVGLLAGSYPALFLSAFKPIEVLKGKLKMGSKSGTLRSVLVVFQFFISIVLIIGTIVIYRQLSFIQNKNIGFNKNQVLIINDAYNLGNNVQAFKNDVEHLPGVKKGTISGFLPVSSSSRSDNSFSTEAVMDVHNGFNMQVWDVDYDYLETMGMDVVKGRNFSRDFGSDSSGMLINEATAKILGMDNPVGKKLYTMNLDSQQKISYTILGVVRNFNYESLRQTVGPLCFKLQRSYGLASFRVNAGNISSLIPTIENKWKSMAPGMPFSYRFLDDSFDEMYRAEQRAGKIALIFSTLAIFIACLGLFGLVTFIAEQRTKEIGIRKVLGASVNGIVQLLSKDFMKLVAIAFIIAAPVSWFFMNKWLQNFAYRTDITWWIFALAAVLALFIALATISFQAIKAALNNPVKSLRTE
ncbi:ABC transporter permease [Danxiaibacter flavus]|uniref:ABC transporter permease n=1 Tax=Danxiaibacter flavus TaxID=3049108 RepID=A0ABV3Z7Y0_9BACT|nr:ABC transporter permease [Chitinophagaceae bacterium DXS]